MATEIEATRLMVYNCARLKDNGLGFLKEAAMCKYFSSQVAERVASQAVEVFGGYGFVKDYPVEKYYRDAKIGKIYEGTSNMQCDHRQADAREHNPRGQGWQLRPEKHRKLQWGHLDGPRIGYA